MGYSPERKPLDEELKLLVLYTLEQVGGCTDLQLLQFMVEVDLMNYFDLMICLADLCKQGQTFRVEQDGEWKYEVTDAGREALFMFGARIPKRMQDTVTQNLKRWRARLLRERECQASVRKTDSGEYEVTLTLTDQEAETLRVTLPMPTEEMAQVMAKNWKTRAAGVYGAIIGLLKENDA